MPPPKQWTGDSKQRIIKTSAQKYIDTNADTHVALLQIRSTPLGQGLTSPATLLFNCPIRGIMPLLIRPLINTNNNDDHCVTLVERDTKADKNYDTLRKYNSFLTRISCRS